MRTQNVPKTFQLATNYRSHTGIVNCAHSVIELITRFWPDSIDTLVPEKGIVEGLKPVFLNDWDSDSVRYVSFFLLSNPFSHSCFITRSNFFSVKGAMTLWSTCKSGLKDIHQREPYRIWGPTM